MRRITGLANRAITTSLQSRLVLGFLIATCLTGLVATIVGIQVINKNTIDEVQRKVQQDINTAKLIFQNAQERLAYQVEFIALKSSLHDAIHENNIVEFQDLNAMIREGTHQSDYFMSLDMLTVVDTDGNVIYRAANPSASGDNILWDPVVRHCLNERSPKSATEIMSLKIITAQNPRLSDRVTLDIVKTPQSIEVRQKQLTQGMVLRSAYPIIDNQQNLLGALVGGILLNKDYSVVDKIKETVYHDEKYKGHDMGFATIFQGGVRISTNVMTKDYNRAIGTIVSKEVYDQVIGEGRDWIGRAFVVNDWYISSYSPIYDIDNAIIGMIYTGILEAKYRDMKLLTLLIFLGITTVGMVLAFVISFRLGKSIIKRIRILKQATEAIASGNLDYQLPRDTFSGFDILDEAFNYMAKSLKDRDDRLQKAFQRITRTERLASLGQMAAGVAHEINNPLGGILLYSNLVLEELPPGHPARENMEKIIYQTDRSKKIVQSLLDFARTPSGEMLPLNINDIIKTSIDLIKDQSIFLGIEIETWFDNGLPPIKGDRSRLEEVLLNLFFNAADAMDGNGIMTVKTRLSSTNSIKVSISDTGKGIDKAYLPHIFEPFFTTKDPGQGTGLGLSITYGIIQQLNGIIDVESDIGSGTVFVITLPAYTGDEENLVATGKTVKSDENASIG